MIHRTALALLAAAIVAAPAAAQPVPDPQAAYKAIGAKAGKPVATIAYGTDPQQVGDLRLPPGRGPFPVAIVIHGGCWQVKFDSRAGIAGFAEALTRHGFATWNIEYRRVGNQGGGWPGTFQDIAAAVDKLGDLARTYPLDMKRVTIVGHSAGAHLALWAASRAKLPPPWTAKSPPASVVAIDGPGAVAPFIGVDAEICGSPVIVPLMGGTPQDKPADYAIASPVDHLPLGVRQLLVEGALGELMKPYVAAARAGGDTVRELEPAGANHFDIVTPGTPNGDAVLDFIAGQAFAAPVKVPPKR